MGSRWRSGEPVVATRGLHARLATTAPATEPTRAPTAGSCSACRPSPGPRKRARRRCRLPPSAAAGTRGDGRRRAAPRRRSRRPARAGPGVIVVVGGAETTAAYEGSAAGSLREFGVGYAVGTGEPVLPLSLTVGSWLLRRAGLDGGRARFQAVARDTAVAGCLLMGAELAMQAPRVAMLAMGDGPARRAVGIEGAADPEGVRYDAA